MAWPIPEYSRTQVNQAGKQLCNITGEDVYNQAMQIVTNWRSCHGYPLNTFQATLRQKLSAIDNSAFTAQRLKRTPSIINKLKRLDSMQLSTMHDIGGLRAVVKSLNQVNLLKDSYIQSKRLKHQLVKIYDYIQSPKDSGYRSIHLVYRYKNPRQPSYDGLLLELQLRTQLQHLWATAVETAGTFLDQSLKSSEGPEEWLSFFALTSSAFAHIEGTPLVPQYAHLDELATSTEVKKQEKRLKVVDKLQKYSTALHFLTSDKDLTQDKGSYHLIILDFDAKSITITSYGRRRLDLANEHYASVEKQIQVGKKLQAVLVSTSSIETLKKAYPSYFLDTAKFIAELNKITGNKSI